MSCKCYVHNLCFENGKSIFPVLVCVTRMGRHCVEWLSYCTHEEPDKRVLLHDADSVG